MRFITTKQNQNDYLAHHGILGQKWGQRNGPPYPLSGGDYSEAEKKYLKDKDYKISTKKTMVTYSRNPNRLESDSNLLYTSYKTLDKNWYNAFYNRFEKEPIYDEDGNEIGTGNFLMYKIETKGNKDLKIASEKTSVDSFLDLYRNNRDFYNYVTDPDRMEKAFRETRKDKYIFKAYREALDSLNNIRNSDTPSYEDVIKSYRLFNYLIPYQTDNKRLSNDVRVQRTRLFNELKKKGYSGLFDTNDGKYNKLGVDSPTIIFDMDALIPTSIKRSNQLSRSFSTAVSIGKKAVGL